MREHVPFALKGAVDQDDAGAPRHDILIGDIEAARSRHPVQLAVEDEETDEAEPENRHRVAEETDDTHQMIGPAPLLRSRDHARRNADQHADQRGDRRQFEGSRKILVEIVDDALRGEHRLAQIAADDAAKVDQILLGDRTVEAHGKAGLLVDFVGGVIAHHGDHRVDRDEATDREGHRSQPDEGEKNCSDKP